MSKRLQEDVLFVNVDGMYDYYHNRRFSNDRLELVKKEKEKLINNKCRVLLLNPTDESDIKIPVFPLSLSQISFDLNHPQGELDYSIFLLKYLYDFIKNEHFTHVIIFQYDGYVINFDSWDDAFLKYDFMGNLEDDKTSIINKNNFFSLNNEKYGRHFNGGFSLRSRELIEKCKDIDIKKFYKMFKQYNNDNEDLILLDYINWEKMPKNIEIINKFVGDTIDSKSFGFHKK